MERGIAAVSDAAGFVYLISRLGVTGTRPAVPSDLEAQVARVQQHAFLLAAVLQALEQRIEGGRDEHVEVGDRGPIGGPQQRLISRASQVSRRLLPQLRLAAMPAKRRRVSVEVDCPGSFRTIEVEIPAGAPNLSLDIPCMWELARKNGVPISGKDFKTGQTLMKTIIAPGLKARLLGLDGWYSTNILGNRDGEVLDDPESFKTKEESKLGVLEYILQPELYPDLYGKVYHKVRINYYPPRGDNKEGWDNIDIFGWLGYPMQIKVDFLCRDSILAAPIVLDLALFFDLAQRAGLSGVQEWLSFYFKSPQTAAGLYPEHDLFIQQTKLKNTLRWLMGEEQITHLGVEYYDYGDQ